MPRSIAVAFALAFIALSSCPTAAKAAGDTVGTTAILRGVTKDEADFLIGQLGKLQTQLASGENVYFELLSGAPASYPETAISPRQAFLEMPFDRTGWIERTSTHPQWVYKLTIQPGGNGSMVWDVEVVLDRDANVERIEMFTHPPAPF